MTSPWSSSCHSIGDTLDEAIQNAQEAIALYLETLKSRGQPIPEETEHPRAIVVGGRGVVERYLLRGQITPSK